MQSQYLFLPVYPIHSSVVLILSSQYTKKRMNLTYYSDCSFLPTIGHLLDVSCLPSPDVSEQRIPLRMMRVCYRLGCSPPPPCDPTQKLRPHRIPWPRPFSGSPRPNQANFSADSPPRGESSDRPSEMLHAYSTPQNIFLNTFLLFLFKYEINECIYL